jgi:flavorubredoxin
MSNLSRLGDHIVVLSDNVPLDGRISWAPKGVAGFEPHNKFLLLTQDRALLIDTGVAAHEHSLLASLDGVVGSRQLAVLLTRNELDCIGNLGALLDRRPDAEVVTTNSLPVVGLVHMMRTDRASISVRRCPPGSDLRDLGFPQVRIVTPVVRLLGTGWVLDESSRTLFTSDFFGVETLGTPDQDVIRTGIGEMLAHDAVTSGLLAKFDWLALADAERVLEKWDKFFADTKIEALAPSHGRIQSGAHVVQMVVQRYRTAVANASCARPNLQPTRA